MLPAGSLLNPAGEDVMEFTEAVHMRRMVRNYLPDPVSDEVLNRILDSARRAPSAGFSQGQAFIVDFGISNQRDMTS